MDIPSRANWFVGDKPDTSIFDDKNKIIEDYMCMLFTRTNTMFEYDGLPETIPKEDYQLIKQTFGSATIKEVDGKLYAFYGGLGGRLNEYYHPTRSIVTNPYLNYNADLEIGVDCIVIKNDLFYRGIYNINRKYAELLTECDISMRKCLLNIRVDNIITSSSEKDDVSIKLFFDAVKKGDFAYITTKKFMDDALLTIHDVSSKTSNPLKDIMEIRNYIESCWWMEFGLNANSNMKREAINENEINADDKTMIPLIKQYYDCEIKGWDEVNKMYGTNVKVRLSDVWQKMYDEVVKDEEVKIEEDVKNTNEEGPVKKDGESNEEN